MFVIVVFVNRKKIQEEKWRRICSRKHNRCADQDLLIVLLFPDEHEYYVNPELDNQKHWQIFIIIKKKYFLIVIYIYRNDIRGSIIYFLSIMYSVKNKFEIHIKLYVYIYNNNNNRF